MYKDYFGLKEEPFNVTPDPRFIYFSRKHRDAFSSLLYGIQSRKGFVQLTGEIGAGKTTLCRAFLEKIRTETKTALILNPQISENSMLKTIADDFGISVKGDSRKACFDALNAFLLAEFHRGNNCVLIIDEAQTLSAKALEQIRLLSNVETDREKLIQIVLIGQPELKETLKCRSLAQLRQRIAIRFHLTALDREEVHEYIRHRLTVAGLPKGLSTPFTPEALDFIYEKTGGVPRLINNLSNTCLLAAYGRSFYGGLAQVDGNVAEDAYNELEGIAV